MELAREVYTVVGRRHRCKAFLPALRGCNTVGSCVKTQGEPACKPGSVEGNHSSGTPVAEGLKRPTRKRARTALRPVSGSLLPYLALLQVGFALPSVLPPTRCALTAPFHPCRPPRLTSRKLGRSLLCCTFRGLTPPRRYLAPRPPEPGLSSILAKGKNSDYPAGSPRHHTSPCGEPQSSIAAVTIAARPRSGGAEHHSLVDPASEDFAMRVAIA